MEQAILSEHFSGMDFYDKREKDVFLSYLRGFAVLFFDPTVKNIVEIGAGQSTAIFALLAERCRCLVTTIDMNPDAMDNRIRDAKIRKRVREQVNFVKGLSVSRKELDDWYELPFREIAGIPAARIIEASETFVRTTRDHRKESSVRRALKIPNLDVTLLSAEILKSQRFPQALLQLYRSESDEFSQPSNRADVGLLDGVMRKNEVNAVFLDGGEFSSLLDWEIVQGQIQRGGYVILHDIFFPKSFKNWLICSFLTLSAAWQVVYVDRSTPQGLMLAKKR